MEKAETNKKFRYDIFLILILLLTGLALLGFAFLSGRGGASAQVSVDGKIIAVYPLSEDRTEVINTPEGKNRLEIKDGRVRVTDADCPDKLCVNQGWISMKGQSVICLPHKLTVKITGEEAPESKGADIVVK